MSRQTLGVRIGKLRGEAHRREISGVIARWREWKGTQAAFCESVGISTQSLSRWRKLVGDAPARSPFVEVSSTLSSTSMCYEIVLSSGACVRAPAGFDDDEVTRLLALAIAAC